MHTVKKCYRDLPASHRQPNHKGHCSQIHGHNWGFNIYFQCDELDDNGFVIDVGELRFVKDWLETRFDHTLLLNWNDPRLAYYQTVLLPADARIVVVPNCGMEGLAKFVFESVGTMLIENEELSLRGVRVYKVECLEDSKNSAIYTL